MSELAMIPRRGGIVAKTARRVAVALTMSIGVGLLIAILAATVAGVLGGVLAALAGLGSM